MFVFKSNSLEHFRPKWLCCSSSWCFPPFLQIWGRGDFPLFVLKDVQTSTGPGKHSQHNQGNASLDTNNSKKWTTPLHVFVLQMFPRPDVVECCLVLLHLDKSSSVSDVLRQQAKDLLRKYGTSLPVLKASRGFLTWSGFPLDSNASLAQFFWKWNKSLKQILSRVKLHRNVLYLVRRWTLMLSTNQKAENRTTEPTEHLPHSEWAKTLLIFVEIIHFNLQTLPALT